MLAREGSGDLAHFRGTGWLRCVAGAGLHAADAGFGADTADVAEVDGLTLIDEALRLEAAGFAAPGEGLRTLAEDPRANPSGGGAAG